MYEKIDTDDRKVKFREERKRLSENHFNRANTLGAWLLATLAATNLACGAAVLANSRGGNAATAQPAIAFAVGVVSALLSGFVFAFEANLRSSQYYLESCEEESLTDSGLGRLAFTKLWGVRMTWVGRILNGTSLTCFIVGSSSVAAVS